jgi:glycerol uptake facilitator-like aquaporin
VTPFGAELVACCVFALFGTAASCAAVLPRTAAHGTRFATLAAAWGAALALALFVGDRAGAHVNPAVTLAAWMCGGLPGAELVERVGGQFVGAFVGMALAAAAFVPQWSRADPVVASRALWRTPEVDAPLATIAASAVGTGAFAFVMLRIMVGEPIVEVDEAVVADGTVVATEFVARRTPFILTHRAEGALLAGLSFALALAGPGATGAPITPTLGPCGRLVHRLLPSRSKGRTEWRGTWISFAGPALGAALAAFAWRATAGSAG